MVKAKRDWHSPAKQIEGHEEGKCPYCHKFVNSIQSHIHDKHKSAKPFNKQ